MQLGRGHQMGMALRTASQQREAMRGSATNDELSVARALFSKLAQDLHAYHLNDGGAGLPSLEGVARGSRRGGGGGAPRLRGRDDRTRAGGGGDGGGGVASAVLPRLSRRRRQRRSRARRR